VESLLSRASDLTSDLVFLAHVPASASTDFVYSATYLLDGNQRIPRWDPRHILREEERDEGRNGGERGRAGTEAERGGEEGSNQERKRRRREKRRGSKVW
jgi:hypothetical protein